MKVVPAVGLALLLVILLLGVLAVRAVPSVMADFPCGPGATSFFWDNFDQQGRWLEGGMGCSYPDGRVLRGEGVTPQDLQGPPLLEVLEDAARPILFHGFLR